MSNWKDNYEQLSFAGETELKEAIAQQKKQWQQRQYNRHVLKFFIDLDYIQYDGFPRITVWPRGSVEIARPHILKFICVKDGQKHEMSPNVSLVRLRGGLGGRSGKH